MTSLERRTAGGGSAEWQTPPALWEQIKDRYQPNYDAFASHQNALCDMYSTPEGTFFGLTLNGEPYTFDTRDGLSFIPSGGRFVRFANPPYSRGLIKQCVQWLYESREHFALTIALLPVDTSTDWWQDYVAERAHIDFLPKRVQFVHPPFKCKDGCAHALGEIVKGSPGGYCIAVYKKDWVL